MAVPKTIDKSKMYQIKLSGVVELHPGVFAKPTDDLVVVSGAALEAIRDKVIEATPVDSN